VFVDVEGVDRPRKTMVDECCHRNWTGQRGVSSVKVYFAESDADDWEIHSQMRRRKPRLMISAVVVAVVVVVDLLEAMLNDSQYHRHVVLASSMEVGGYRQCYVLHYGYWRRERKKIQGRF
jgi:nucleoside-diphosphate-sugar epimerase